MPQIFQVLRCFKCLVFQVHQTKKSNKWGCKLCNEKQSVKRHYGLGTGKECRVHVQKLNSLHGEITEQNDSIEIDEDSVNNVKDTKQNIGLVQPKKESKWKDYIHETEPNIVESIEDEGNIFIDDKKIVFKVPKKRKKLLATDPHRNKKAVIDFLGHKCTLNSHKICANNVENISTVKIDVTLNKLEKESASARSLVKFVPPKIDTRSKWAQYNEKSNSIDDDNVESLLKSYSQNSNKYVHEPEEVLNNSICNTFFAINNIELQNKMSKLHKQDVVSAINKISGSIDSLEHSSDLMLKNSLDGIVTPHTPETIKSNTTSLKIKYSKWAEFTEDYDDIKDYSDNKFESPSKNNLDDYATNAIITNSTLTYYTNNTETDNSLDPNDFLQEDNANISNNKKKSTFSLFDDGDLDALDI